MAIRSEAQNKAVQRYIARHYDRVMLTMPQGERDEIKAAASAAGSSVNSYIMESVRERMKREKAD